MNPQLQTAIAALKTLPEADQTAIATIILQEVTKRQSVPVAGSPDRQSRTIKSIYTDGACSGNPGRGGWGVVVYFSDGSIYEIGGKEAQTTNNRMELQAAIAALEFLQQANQKEPVELYTDSEYVKNGITKWIHGWKKKGWKTSTGKAVLNQDLWEELDALNHPQIQWRYVRGHAGNIGNERCDEIARAFAIGKVPQLQQDT
ncbi:MAG TPA: ribonuclease HI [Leptolyngbyaceae cyanobacterium M33_DOE_097]|uniref:Ribonuclease H n=1 Tax=Oscillatoriales cyanobacterium SpSt-418 TaxID=2282169 RepID=A0A7C3PIK5_9CYAN|nr:ribonuclease HI [Leptolyngbyaceae cyanobacterium M33_DOE_097]